MRKGFWIPLIIVLFVAISCMTNTSYLAKSKTVSETESIINGTDGWVLLQENQRVDEYYRKNDSVYCGEVSCGVEPMNGIDINSFKVYPGSSYAKDKNAVYYPLQIMCVDYTDCGVCYCNKNYVEGAQPLTFNYLGKDYATDSNTVYYRGEVLSGADPESMKVLKGPKFFFFAHDNNHVYIHDQVFPDADPETFFYDSTHSKNDTLAYNYILKDKNHTWIYTPPLQITLMDSLKSK